eukprot:TRINITY_DN45251_c0_g1_i1.p1 TRINITY_DN45251_c0_g1~~TRINITY_DN45251_c0_g1_i1.p1  ORF type:complete len:117 (-),score=13.28 TRINITY_DN45251_c0_g1_i1:54-365(-)
MVQSATEDKAPKKAGHFQGTHHSQRSALKWALGTTGAMFLIGASTTAGVYFLHSTMYASFLASTAAAAAGSASTVKAAPVAAAMGGTSMQSTLSPGGFCVASR